MGGTELLILLAIILLFFGARRVPQLGRSLGQSLQEFRKGASVDPQNELSEPKEKAEMPPQKEDSPLKKHALRIRRCSA